jgi:hypothetical protein
LEAVEAEFVLGVEEDEEATGQTETEAGDIDEGEDPVAGEVAQGDGNITPEHVVGFG